MKKILIILLGNIYLVLFLTLPYLFLRFLAPFIVGFCPIEIIPKLTPESIVEWSNSTYWAYLSVYLVLAYFISYDWDDNAADVEEFGVRILDIDKDGVRIAKGFEEDFKHLSIEGQKLSAFENMMFWLQVPFLPGAVTLCVVVEDLWLLGLKMIKKPSVEIGRILSRLMDIWARS